MQRNAAVSLSSTGRTRFPPRYRSLLHAASQRHSACRDGGSQTRPCVRRAWSHTMLRRLLQHFIGADRTGRDRPRVFHAGFQHVAGGTRSGLIFSSAASSSTIISVAAMLCSAVTARRAGVDGARGQPDRGQIAGSSNRLGGRADHHHRSGALPPSAVVSPRNDCITPVWRFTAMR